MHSALIVLDNALNGRNSRIVAFTTEPSSIPPELGDPIVDGFTGFPGRSTTMRLGLIFKGIPVPSQAIIFQLQTNLRLIYSIIVGQYIDFPPVYLHLRDLCPPWARIC